MNKPKCKQLVLVFLCAMLGVSSAYATSDEVNDTDNSQYCKPSGPKVGMTISKATWGRNPANNRNPVVFEVDKIIDTCCKGRETCAITPNHEWLGDPLPGEDKTLLIKGDGAYCGASRKLEINPDHKVWEGETMTIKCVRK